VRQVGGPQGAAVVEAELQKKSVHAAEQDRPDVAERRAAWRVSQAGFDPTKLVFIDETWAKTNVTRLRGRAPVGARLVDEVPHGHWKTTTLIAALDHRGMRCSTVVDGAVNRDVFEAFVEQVLAPTLSPGDVVVMDNLSSHKGERLRALIEARRCCRPTARTEWEKAIAYNPITPDGMAASRERASVRQGALVQLPK
jgi:hypothetical protein